MSEEVSEIKVVNRKVAIALGIICIILVSGVIGVTTYYTTLHNDYVSSHSYSNDEYTTQRNGDVKYERALEDQVQNLTYILNMENVATHDYYGIPLPANFTTHPVINEYFFWTPEVEGKYAGIFFVQVSSSTNQTYVNVTYSTNPDVYEAPQFNYSSQTDIGTYGTVYFPFVVGWGTYLNIRIAVHDVNIEATANITITYYY